MVHMHTNKNLWRIDIEEYVSGCDAVGSSLTGSSLSGNMLNFQASVSGNGQRFSALQMRLWHLLCQRTPLGCNLVSHVCACWLTGLGLGTLVGTWQERVAGTPVKKVKKKEWGLPLHPR